LHSNVSYIETYDVQGQLFFGHNDWWHEDPWCGNRRGTVQWLKAADAEYNALAEDSTWGMPLDCVPWSPPDPNGRQPWNDTIGHVLFEGSGCIRFYPHAVDGAPAGPAYEMCYAPDMAGTLPMTLYYWKIPEDFVPPGWEDLGSGNGGALYNNVSYIETYDVEGQLFFGRNDWWHEDPWCDDRRGGVQWLKAADAEHNPLAEDSAWEMALDCVPWSPPDPNGRHPWNDMASHVLFEGSGCIRFYPHAVNGSPAGQPYELCYAAPPLPTATPTPGPTLPAEGVAVCHHGLNGMEFLVAYTEADLSNGIPLDDLVAPPWDGQAGTWFNDGLKSCRLDNTWHLSPPAVPFNAVSYIRLEDGRLSVCWDTVGGLCAGQEAQMIPGQPEDIVQELIANAITPTRSRQIIAWMPTNPLVPLLSPTSNSGGE